MTKAEITFEKLAFDGSKITEGYEKVKGKVKSFFSHELFGKVKAQVETDVNAIKEVVKNTATTVETKLKENNIPIDKARGTFQKVNDSLKNHPYRLAAGVGATGIATGSLIAVNKLSNPEMQQC